VFAAFVVQVESDRLSNRLSLLFGNRFPQFNVPEFLFSPTGFLLGSGPEICFGADSVALPFIRPVQPLGTAAFTPVAILNVGALGNVSRVYCKLNRLPFPPPPPFLKVVENPASLFIGRLHGSCS
jgi:hypothetical protein